MAENFASVSSLEEAAEQLNFKPFEPGYTAGYTLTAIRIYVRDYKQRELSRAARSLECYYGSFVFSQSSPGRAQARRQALSTRYGREAATANIGGHEGRLYEMGPPVPDDDIDGRAPAVVTWHDAERFFLLASDQLPAITLQLIAESVYPA